MRRPAIWEGYVACHIKRGAQSAAHLRKKGPLPVSVSDQTSLATRGMMTDIALNELAGYWPRGDTIYNFRDICLESVAGPEIQIATVLEWFSAEMFAQT